MQSQPSQDQPSNAAQSTSPSQWALGRALIPAAVVRKLPAWYVIGWHRQVYLRARQEGCRVWVPYTAAGVEQNCAYLAHEPVSDNNGTHAFDLLHMQAWTLPMLQEACRSELPGKMQHLRAMLAIAERYRQHCFLKLYGNSDLESWFLLRDRIRNTPSIY